MSKGRNVNLRESRIGEKSTSKFGQTMEIIAYRDCDDIDVRFENGAIVEHKRYDKFKKGSIRNPKLHLGETFITKQGLKATIVEYRHNSDIDVQLEDGRIFKNTTYANFKNWLNSSENKLKIAHEKDLKHTQKELYNTKVKLEATQQILKQLQDVIKNKDNEKEIQVKMSKHNTNSANNGTNIISITANATPDSPLNLSINLPPSKLPTQLNINILPYTTSTKTAKVKHNTHSHVETTSITKESNPMNAKEHTIRKAKPTAKYRIGETSVAHNGQTMKIIDYRTCNDIDVEFEDGTIVENRTYGAFKKGSIKNPTMFIQ